MVDQREAAAMLKKIAIGLVIFLILVVIAAIFGVVIGAAIVRFFVSLF